MFKIMHDELALIELMAHGIPIRWRLVKHRPKVWLGETKRQWIILGEDPYDPERFLSFSRLVITDEPDAVRVMIRHSDVLTEPIDKYVAGAGAIDGGNWEKIEEALVRAKRRAEEGPISGEVFVENARIGYWMRNEDARERTVLALLDTMLDEIALKTDAYRYCIGNYFDVVPNFELIPFEKRIRSSYVQLRKMFDLELPRKEDLHGLAIVLGVVMKLPVMDDAGLILTTWDIEEFPLYERTIPNCDESMYVYGPTKYSAYVLRYFEGVDVPLCAYEDETDNIPQAYYEGLKKLVKRVFGQLG